MLDEKTIQDLKDNYGEIYELKSDSADEDYKIKEYVFMKPTRVHLSRFAKGVANDTFKALHTLIMDCLVYPDKGQVQEQLDEKPGLVVSLGGELQKIVGINENFFATKL